MRTFEFDGEGADGEAMNPGRGPVPVGIVGKKQSRGRKPKEGDEEPTTNSGEATAEVPEAVFGAVTKALGKDGATRDMIRRGINKTKKLRDLVSNFPGELDGVLTSLVAGDKLKNEDDFYYVVSEEEADAGF